MAKSTITSKGQTTVPRQVREHLGVGPGDTLAWDTVGGAVHELVYVLLNVYDQRRGATAEIVSDLLALPGVQTLDSLEWGQVLRMWPEPLHDFADAALAAACRSGGHDAVATFDVTFARALQELGLRSYWDLT